jgi:hypothetical protein
MQSPHVEALAQGILGRLAVSFPLVPPDWRC